MAKIKKAALGQPFSFCIVSLIRASAGISPVKHRKRKRLIGRRILLSVINFTASCVFLYPRPVWIASGILASAEFKFRSVGKRYSSTVAVISDFRH